MKLNEIVIGGEYTDEKGGVRRIIAMGPQYTFYPGQVTTDNLRFLILKSPFKAGEFAAGKERNTTRGSFASWARKRIN
jgi:hypothetical protein